MTSQDTGGVRLPDGRAAASVCWRGSLGHCGGLRRRLDALHEGWVLLDEGGVHFGWVGPSCSTHNPWPVDPDPRGAGLLKAEPASGHSLPVLCAGGGQESVGRTCDGGAGLCRKDPGLALCGLVSTVLTLTGPASMFPAGIVGILRFFFVVRRRCACDVSTMDTDPPSCLAPKPPSLSGPPACPGFPAERVVSQKS